MSVHVLQKFTLQQTCQLNQGTASFKSAQSQTKFFTRPPSLGVVWNQSPVGQTQARPLGQELTPCVAQGSTTEDPMRPRSKKENRPSDLRAYGVSTVPILYGVEYMDLREQRICIARAPFECHTHFYMEWNT